MHRIAHTKPALAQADQQATKKEKEKKGQEES